MTECSHCGDELTGDDVWVLHPDATENYYDADEGMSPDEYYVHEDCYREVVSDD